MKSKIGITLMSVIMFVSLACSSNLADSKNNYEQYLLNTKEQFEDIEAYNEEYIALIYDGESEAALKILQNDLLSSYKEVITDLENVKLSDKTMKELKEKHLAALNLEADLHKMLLENFLLIKGTTEKGADELQLAHSFDGVYLYVKNVDEQQAEAEALYEELFTEGELPFIQIDFIKGNNLSQIEDHTDRRSLY